MEELQKRHRQDQRDLQSRITQKKKGATKKTRKGVSDECAELERRLLEKQAAELSQLDGAIIPATEMEPAISQHNETTPEGPATEAQKVDQSQSTVDGPNPEGRSRKPNRQKARLAKRAAEQEAAVEEAAKDAANLPDLRQIELNKMREAAASRGLQEHDIRPDGHCLYASIADQLKFNSIDWTSSSYAKNMAGVTDASLAGYRVLRYVTAAYMKAHPDDFTSFLEKPLEQHLHDVRDTGEWGGHIELLAMAKSYSISIKVLHANGRIDEIEGSPPGNAERAPLWLAYYQHSFGLGEHYNSLRSSGG